MPFEIIQSDTHIDFIGKRQLAALISGGLIIASLIAIPIRGVNLGVDFAGGTEIQIQFGADAPAGEGTIRELVGAMGVQGASVVELGRRPLAVSDLQSQRPIDNRVAQSRRHA